MNKNLFTGEKLAMLKFVILLNKWDVNKVYWARKASRANQMAYVTFRLQYNLNGRALYSLLSSYFTWKVAGLEVTQAVL